MSGWLRNGRLGNFCWKISMMRNMAENMGKAQLRQRWGSIQVWSGVEGKREEREETQDGEP